MKDGESSMEQAELLVQILAEIRQQNAMLQSTIDALREQSRQKDEEIERLRQIILNLQRAQFGQRSEKRTYILNDVHPGTLAKSGEGNLCLRSQPEEKARAGRALCDAAGGRENRESESEASC